MFFVLSKVAGFFAQPSNLLFVVAAVGIALTATRWRRLGRIALVLSLSLLAVAGYSPLANILLHPLEQRFPPWGGQGDVAGIIVLGGAVDPAISRARNVPALNEAAERMTAAVALAQRFPRARLLFSGGSGALLPDGDTEAAAARLFFQDIGIAPERIEVEDRSRNTVENARFTAALAGAKPGERWLLVTSAYHMPRSVGVFRQAGFAVEAYPVDWRTRWPGDTRGFSNLSDGLRRTDTVVREWIGLLMYRLAGYTSELFPGP